MGLPQSNTHATFCPRGVTSGHTWLEVDERPISKLKSLMGAQWMAGQVVMCSAEIQAKQQRKDQHESQSNVYRKCMLVSPCGREWFCLTLDMQGSFRYAALSSSAYLKLVTLCALQTILQAHKPVASSESLAPHVDHKLVRKIHDKHVCCLCTGSPEGAEGGRQAAH